jgi:hypothetical protein
MNLTCTRRRNNEKGSMMVESAFVLLTILAMMIFILDMGRMLMMQQFLVERVRSTVRSAVVNNWDATAIKNYLVYNSTTAPGGGGAGYMGLLTSEVSYQTLGTAGDSDYRLQVKVSGVPVLTWIPFISGSYTLAPVMATMPAESLGASN